VSKHSIYKADCATLSTDFSNAADMTSSLVSGLLYATLSDETVAKTYDFCLKVTATDIFIDVPSLVFKVCSLSTIIPSVAIIL